MKSKGAEAALVRRVLERSVEFIEEMHLAEVLSADFEIVALPYEVRDAPWEPGDEEDALVAEEDEP